MNSYLTPFFTFDENAGLNFEYYIARRIYFSGDHKNRISGPAVKVALAGIMLGVIVMVLTVAIITGFKKEVIQKVIGLGSHIRITNFDSNNSFKSQPIVLDSSFLSTLSEIEGIRSMQKYATEPGIIKHESQLQTVVIKGLDSDFDWDFFNASMVDGNSVTFGTGETNDTAIISRSLSKMLGLKPGDRFHTYFFQNKIRGRALIVGGIYETNFPEFDKTFVLTDIRQVRKLNGWDSTQVSGLEILLDDFDDLDEIGEKVFLIAANNFNEDGSSLLSRTIKELYGDIFGWLALLDMNVWIILFLMISVAAINMISGVLILILERTQMIGILKSMGAENWSIRKIFLYQSFFLTGKGMLWGNVIALLICFVQARWHLIPLDPVNYYVDSVPINLNFLLWAAINAGTLILTISMMVLPSYIITKIIPAKSIQFE